MPQNFDEEIGFANMASRKWDDMESYYGIARDEGLSMWIADMDFPVAEPIRKAVLHSVDRGLFTYYTRHTVPLKAFCDWQHQRHQWRIDESWVRHLFGVGPGLAIAIQEFTEPGDEIIAFTPVYHGIRGKIRLNRRTLVQAELALRNGQYEMDLQALRKNLTGRERMVIHCSPHNPGGRVWTVEEQKELAAFCNEFNLMLVSDEVHQDLVFDGTRHVPMAVAAPEITPKLITLTAPSKAFNVAGATTGFAIIEDPDLRRKYTARLNANGDEINRLGADIAQAAYTQGEPWLLEVIAYLDENRKLFCDGVNAIPGVNAMDMQSTYLAWVDFSGTGMTQEEISGRVTNVAKIAASPGPGFGRGGEGFMRFNIATRKALVQEAVERLQAAFSDLQ